MNEPINTTRRAALVGAIASTALLAVPPAASTGTVHERIRWLVAELAGALKSPEVGFDSVTVTADFARQSYQTAGDIDLLRLGSELDRHCAALKALNALPFVPGECWDRAFARCEVTVAKIETCPASTLQGLRVKAKAVAWCRSDQPVINLAEDSDTTDLRIASSLLHDLLAMEG